MHWDGPILTDSGGYQVMSLAKLRRIDEQGVTFQSHIDGATVALTPGARHRGAMPARLRHPDGARRMHAVSGDARGGESLARAVAPLGRALQSGLSQAWPSPARPCSASCRAASIPICGERCADALIEIGFDGYAVGGLAVGEGQGAMLDMVETTTAVLPEDRPRYLMGVGTPEDLLASIARGIDMFDCVLPTRSGRHCQAFTWGGRLNLRNARYAEDPTPLDAGERLPRRAL